MVRVNFQTRIPQNSPDECLANFLSRNDGIGSKKELIWNAVKAYWSAIAMHEAKRYSQEEIIRCASICLSMLESQKGTICMTVGLNPSNLYQPGSGVIVTPKQGNTNSERMSSLQIEEASQLFGA